LIERITRCGAEAVLESIILVTISCREATLAISTISIGCTDVTANTAETIRLTGEACGTEDRSISVRVATLSSADELSRLYLLTGTKSDTIEDVGEDASAGLTTIWVVELTGR
jgi:hypothetical protein